MDESGSRYAFLVDTYRTERLKVSSVWSMFEDADLPARPLPETETRLEFIRQYARDTAPRLETLRATPDDQPSTERPDR